MGLASMDDLLSVELPRRVVWAAYDRAVAAGATNAELEALRAALSFPQTVVETGVTVRAA